VGTQYRSEIFYADPSQQKIGQAYIAQLNDMKAYCAPIVTQIGALEGFYPAEDYHQDYLVKHPHKDHIVYFDSPKLGNLKRLFPDAYNATPVMVSELDDHDVSDPRGRQENLVWRLSRRSDQTWSC